MTRNIKGFHKLSSKEIGNLGEDIAEDYLIKNGYDILRRNFYSQYGEIDIIAKFDDQIRFIEVKTRTNERFGNPEESVNQKKIECMISTALCYLEEFSTEDQNWHLDLLSIKLKSNSSPEIILFEDIND
jgi:putative endonuclease